MNLIYKIKLIIWYLKYPKYYRHLINFLIFRLARLINKKDEDLISLKNWCNNNSVNLIQIIKILFNENKIFDFYSIPDVLNKKNNKKKINNKLGGSSFCNLIYNISLYKNPIQALELGVALGWSSFAFLISQQNNNNFKLISNDMPYPFVQNNSYIGSVIPERLKDKWILYKYPDVSILDKIFKLHGKFDIIHYDSDKSYEGRTKSYKKLYKNLNHNGILISDDINDNSAFKNFVEEKKLKFYTIEYENRYLGVIIKND